MNTWTWIVATVCTLASLALAVMASRRFGVARLAWSPIHHDVGDRIPGPRRFVGVLRADGPTVLAPFTDRAVLYARAQLRGVGPDGKAPKTLWHKLLAARVRLTDREDRSSLDVDLSTAEIIVPKAYRDGTTRALAPTVRLLPRMLARAGYDQPPPSSRWFHLDEEVIEPNATVHILGFLHRDGRITGVDGGPVIVSTLAPWRVVLRLAWGPALALVLALVMALATVTTVGFARWLSAESPPSALETPFQPLSLRVVFDGPRARRHIDTQRP